MKFLGTRIGHRSRMPYYPPRSFLAPGSGASLTASLSTRGDEPSTSGRNVTLDYHPLRGLGRGGRLLRPFSAAAAASSSSPAPAAASTGPAAVWREVLPTPVNVQDDQRALHTVSVALYANFTIFLAKLGVWLLSGSSSMLAEAVHSLVDVANQMFLRMGIQRAAKKPTSAHPYGFYRDKFVYSLISAVGVLCLGGGITFVHGIQAIMAPAASISYLFEGLMVLGVSFFVEGYSLLVAVKAVADGAKAVGVPFWTFVSSGRDPTSIAVMLEDAAAVSGVTVAAICTWLAHSTGNMFFDGLGSVLVGTLLGATALFLIQNNRRLLIGRAMSPNEAARVLKYLEKDSVVAAVFDAKSEELGPGIFRFKAEIAFSGDTVVDRHVLKNPAKAELIKSIREAAANGDEPTLDYHLKRLGREVSGALGWEIDRLEQEIRQLVPGIRHVDLEADRGRWFDGNSIPAENSDLRPDVSKDTYWSDDFSTSTPPVNVNGHSTSGPVAGR